MLLSFQPIKDEHGKQIIPTVIDYSNKVACKIGNLSMSAWLSTYVPMIFANASNLANNLTHMCVDVNDMYKMYVRELDLALVYVELRNRFGYLTLYRASSQQLLFACYCGEITLTLAIKNMFESKIKQNDVRNICIVAPIDCLVTVEEPYKDEWKHINYAFKLGTFSYICLDGSILKCKSVGRGGKDLQVVDKFYITNKMPDLVKALSHQPTELIHCDNLLAAYNKTAESNMLSDRLTGNLLPVAKFGMTTALTDLHNTADIVVALAKTPRNDAVCATLSNDWLKRAVKHKLNKYPPEVTSDGKYEVQRLTTEATIKYQGDTWKGAKKTDLIYVIVEKVSRRPVSIISIGAQELNYITKRKDFIQNAIKSNKKLVIDLTLTFTKPDIDTALCAELIDKKSSIYSALNETSPEKYNEFLTYLATKPGRIGWIDLFDKEAELTTCCPATGLTFGDVFSAYNARCKQLTNMDTYYVTGVSDIEIRRINQPNTIVKVEQSLKEVECHSFNFPTVTAIIPTKNGNTKTYKGYAKFGFAILKNIEDEYDTFMLCTDKLYKSSEYKTYALCDYIFPSKPLHESIDSALASHEGGYQFTVSNAIYGKKLALPAGIDCYADVAKVVSTGKESTTSIISVKYSLGYVPNTIDEYNNLVKVEDQLKDLTDRNKTQVYSSYYDEDELLDEMDDFVDDEEYYDEYTDDYAEELAELESQNEDSYSDDDDYNDEDVEDDYSGEYADDNDDYYDESDDDYSDLLEEENNWESQRMLWLRQHPDLKSILRNNKEVYWFDAMHLMMLSDQPESANNIQFMETIWNSMLSKMGDCDPLELVGMMYDQLSDDSGSSGSDDAQTNNSDAASGNSSNDITDDNDDLFAGL